jgi:serine/threonine protein kinase
MGSGRGHMASTRGPRQRGTLSPEDEVTDETTGERYRILSLIGEGGMGRVYRAERAHDGQVVAVKCNQPIDPSNPELVERMKREGDFLKALRPHPHIAPVLAAGVRTDGVFWIAMPLLDGASVGGLLSVLGRIPLVWVLEISGAICSALATVHEVGIHRDIKPENVFVTRQGGVYLLDFGAGKAYVVGRLTTTGTAIGTIPYMSPEQLSDTQLDGRSDLFSVGVLTYEMLTGEHPFDHDGPLRGNRYLIGQRILTDPPRPLATFAPELPRFTAQIVEKLLSKPPELRARDAAEAAKVFWTAGRELRSRLGEPPPITRMFEAYDEILSEQEAERLGILDTEKAPPREQRSGPRSKRGTQPIAALRPSTTPLPIEREAAPPPSTPTREALDSDAEQLDLHRKLQALERLLTDPTPETREVLLVTLRDHEHHPAVRAGAAIALGVVGDADCLSALEKCAQTDPVPMVRRMAEQAALDLCRRVGLPIEPVALPRPAELPAAPAAPAASPSDAAPLSPAQPPLLPVPAPADAGPTLVEATSADAPTLVHVPHGPLAAPEPSRAVYVAAALIGLTFGVLVVVVAMLLLT